MEQLIFIGIILAFSILEAIARGKKQRQGGGAPPLPQEQGEPPVQRLPQGPRMPSYDEEPSFDDAVEEGGEGPRRREPMSSEGLIPADFWEEIETLARGRLPSPPTHPPAPKEQKPPPRRAPLAPEPRRAAPAPARPPHAVHATHPMMGRPVSERLTPAAGRDRRRTSREVEAVHALLAGGGHALRQAVILQEVLGPPVSERPDPREG